MKVWDMSVAKDALDPDIADECIPLSDLKLHLTSARAGLVSP